MRRGGGTAAEGGMDREAMAEEERKTGMEIAMEGMMAGASRRMIGLRQRSFLITLEGKLD